MIFIDEELTREFGEEIIPLATTWSEQCGIDLCIQWDSYLQFAEHNLLKTFSIREAGEIVGFAIFFLGSPFRENTALRAQLDALYLSPEHRNGLTGYKFIKFCENCMTGDVTEIVYSVLPGFDYSKLLQRLGYNPIETLYRKKVTYGSSDGCSSNNASSSGSS